MPSNKAVATEPPMDLQILNLIQPSPVLWRDSNARGECRRLCRNI